MNVLLLSDFSSVAINATHYAMDLLQNEQVSFTLLNIYEPDPDASEKTREEKRKVTREKLKERVEKLRIHSNNRPHKISGYYSEENLISATRTFVSQNHTDLLVMGAVSKHMRHSTILGNHTFEIILKVKCNILAVPEDVRFQGLKRMLMPIDYSASILRKNLQFLYNENIFVNTSLSVKEIGNTVTFEQRSLKKEIIFSDLNGIRVNFSFIDEAQTYNKAMWFEVQKKFDLIVLLGRNLSICSQLMHNKHGLYTTLPNRLPILVLHD